MIEKIEQDTIKSDHKWDDSAEETRRKMSAEEKARARQTGRERANGGDWISGSVCARVPRALSLSLCHLFYLPRMLYSSTCHLCLAFVNSLYNGDEQH